MSLPAYGMGYEEAKRFLERELQQAESETSFYWEKEETQEAVDLLVDAIAKLIAENNEKAFGRWGMSP